ncbi:MAG: hypothetical protein SFT90_01085 [Rickettsiales bacterium]|nr:hypothetical protein [Rickettsiales bacterium]
MKNLLAIVIIFSLITSSCASIISKSQWPVNFQSNPEGSDVSIIDESGKKLFQGTTPTQFVLDSSDGFFSPAKYEVNFTKKGYKEDKKFIKPTINGWYIANILFGGLIGLLIIDPATGAMYKIKEENIVGNLSKKTAFNYVTKSTIKLSSVPEALKPYLIK